MAREIVELKPILDEVYAAIVRFQRDRSEANVARMRDAMAPAVERLMRFRPLLPPYKQSDFTLLEESWRDLSAHDLIMLFDHCVSIMHIRLERKRSDWEAQQPWTTEMRRLLDSYRHAPAVGPVEGDYLCSGIAAAGGRAAGTARVIGPGAEEWDALLDGEILVCRFTFPEVMPYFKRIRALVTDEGGALSHAAIMAREAGIPAVTGCGDATSAVATGMAIQVDGDVGLVMSAAS